MVLDALALEQALLSAIRCRGKLGISIEIQQGTSGLMLIQFHNLTLWIELRLVTLSHFRCRSQRKLGLGTPSQLI